LPPQADYEQLCYDAKWFLFLPIVTGVLVLFSLGMPLAMARILYLRREKLHDEDGRPIPQPLDILYAIYRREAYYYESVQMVFKLLLWSTLVAFDYGSEMQLATALVVNVVQLCVHMYLRPMGGEEGRLLNLMQTFTLVLTTYINFGAFAMNYLELADEFARHLDSEQEGHSTTVGVISGIMQALTFTLLIAFYALFSWKVFVMSRNTYLGKQVGKAGTAVLHKLSSYSSSRSQSGSKNAATMPSSIEMTANLPSHNRSLSTECEAMALPAPHLPRPGGTGRARNEPSFSSAPNPMFRSASVEKQS